jgi:hypothetical protein
MDGVLETDKVDDDKTSALNANSTAAAPRSFLGFITAKWNASYRLQANSLR